MDEQSQKVFDEIVAKEPNALTEADIGFLKARRSYLSEEQRSKFKEVLAETPEASEEKPAKKDKKDEE